MQLSFQLVRKITYIPKQCLQTLSQSYNDGRFVPILEEIEILSWPIKKVKFKNFFLSKFPVHLG